jgi:hypothetical protein
MFRSSRRCWRSPCRSQLRRLRARTRSCLGASIGAVGVGGDAPRRQGRECRRGFVNDWYDVSLDGRRLVRGSPGLLVNPFTARDLLAVRRTRILSRGYRGIGLRWSPNGRFVAGARFVDGFSPVVEFPFQIFVVRLGSGQVRRLRTSVPMNAPSWSPDSRRNRGLRPAGVVGHQRRHGRRARDPLVGRGRSRRFGVVTRRPLDRVRSEPIQRGVNRAGAGQLTAVGCGARRERAAPAHSPDGGRRPRGAGLVARRRRLAFTYRSRTGPSRRSAPTLRSIPRQPAVDDHREP